MSRLRAYCLLGSKVRTLSSSSHKTNDRHVPGPDLCSEPVAFLPEVDKRMSACATTVQQTPPERTFMGLLKA
jgi:hypothetical protein